MRRGLLGLGTGIVVRWKESIELLEEEREGIIRGGEEGISMVWEGGYCWLGGE